MINHLTPSQDHKEPPFLAECAENEYQHEEEHDPFAEHPAEHGSEEIVEQGSDKGTANSVPHGSVYASQEHNIPQQQSNGEIQVDEIVHFAKHLFPTKIT